MLNSLEWARQISVSRGQKELNHILDAALNHTLLKQSKLEDWEHKNGKRVYKINRNRIK